MRTTKASVEGPKLTITEDEASAGAVVRNTSGNPNDKPPARSAPAAQWAPPGNTMGELPHRRAGVQAWRVARHFHPVRARASSRAWPLVGSGDPTSNEQLTTLAGQQRVAFDSDCREHLRQLRPNHQRHPPRAAAADRDLPAAHAQLPRW